MTSSPPPTYIHNINRIYFSDSKLSIEQTTISDNRLGGHTLSLLMSNALHSSVSPQVRLLKHGEWKGSAYYKSLDSVFQTSDSATKETADIFIFLTYWCEWSTYDHLLSFLTRPRSSFQLDFHDWFQILFWFPFFLSLTSSSKQKLDRTSAIWATWLSPKDHATQVAALLTSWKPAKLLLAELHSKEKIIEEEKSPQLSTQKIEMMVSRVDLFTINVSNRCFECAYHWNYISIKLDVYAFSCPWSQKKSPNTQWIPQAVS